MHKRQTPFSLVAQAGRARLVAAGLALATVLSVAGCMVGPTYSRPDAPVADAWLDSGSASLIEPSQDQRWWSLFNDSTLDSLIAAARAQNLTLRQAGLRVIQSRAARGIAVGQFFPQVQTATADGGNNRISKHSPQGLGDRSYSEESIGLAAAWELDFWGQFRRGIESADAALGASVADYDAVLVLLTADVAIDYVIVRSLQEQLEFTRANVKSQQDTVELTRLRFNAGAVSELDVSTAQATLSNTQSIVPQLEDALRQSTLALCVLMGRTPSDLAGELQGLKAVPSAPAQIALGIPADLLRRRPDVRRAERTAAALSAQIGVATADLYPSVSIRGRTGFRTSTYRSPGLSPGADNLLDADSFQGFIGLEASWPILNYGRVHNSIRVADARYQEAAVAYQNAVLGAAAEVESGLSSFLRSRERAEYLAQSVTAAHRTVELSLIQYRQGAVDFLRVNQAQVNLVERQNSLVVARASVAQGAIATYRALGGGWESCEGDGGGELVPKETVAEMRSRTDWGDILSTHDAQPSSRDTGQDAVPTTGAAQETQHGLSR